jgi:hypothetical protein
LSKSINATGTLSRKTVLHGGEVVVANDLEAFGQLRSIGRVVEPANQPSRSHKRRIAESGVELVRHRSLEVTEQLPTLVVDAEIARRQLEAEFFELAEQGAHEFRVRLPRPSHRVPDADDTLRHSLAAQGRLVHAITVCGSPRPSGSRTRIRRE